MIPKEITLRLDLLKEKAKNYSFISRSYRVDEIRSDVSNINNEISDLTLKVDNILIDGIISNFNIDNWFEGFTDRTEFTEPNPRLVYEEKQCEIERLRKLAEEKKQRELKELYERQKEEKIQTFRKFLVVGNNDFDMIKDFLNKGINIEEDISDIGLNWLLKHGRDLKYIELLINAGLNITEKDRQELARLKKEEESRERQKQEEIEKQKKIEAENEAKEAEERTKRLQIKYRIDEFRKICLDKKSEDLVELQKLIDEGLDVNSINDFDGLIRIVFLNKSLDFIGFLIDSGLHISEKNLFELYSKNEFRFNNHKILNLLLGARNIDPGALKLVKEIVAKKEKAELEQLQLQKQKELEQLQLQNQKEQSNRIKEFKDMCQFSFSADINKLKRLIGEGLNINEIEDFDCLESCITCLNPNLPFIQLLVDSGIMVKNKHITYCYRNKYRNKQTQKNFSAIISILENAKNIEKKALDNIIRRTKIALFTISSLFCFSVILLIYPKLFNSKGDSTHYLVMGITTFIFLILIIVFIDELRRKTKMKTSIQLDGNRIMQSQSKNQTLTIQHEADLKTKPLELKHVRLKKKKIGLWIAISLIVIALSFLFIIYFQDIINFLKVLLVFGVILALFVWAVKNKR
ncbi:MAG: hypothetical protein JNK09_06835 [Prolixibacteraceae bacterium]|nr:hypothetical protein [Prolixibacteraceae bacterium]